MREKGSRVRERERDGERERECVILGGKQVLKCNIGLPVKIEANVVYWLHAGD